MSCLHCGRGILGKRDGKIVIVGRVVRVSWRHEDNAISGAEIGSLIRSDAQSVTKSFFGHGNGCNDKIASGRDIDVLTFDRKPREKELVIRGIAERSEIACVNGVDRNGTVFGDIPCDRSGIAVENKIACLSSFFKCRVDLALETGEKLLPVSDKSVRILCDSLMQCIELTCSGQHWDGKK